MNDSTMNSSGKAVWHVAVWAGVMVIVFLELLVSSALGDTRIVFGILLTLAILSAGLIMMFFMHLKFERRRLVLSMLPALVFILILMLEMFPDSARLGRMHPKFQPSGEQTAVSH